MNEPFERVGPLGPPTREAPPQDDRNEYKPIPGRPGWFVNGKGQMMRRGQIPPTVPWYIRNMP